MNDPTLVPGPGPESDLPRTEAGSNFPRVPALPYTCRKYDKSTGTLPVTIPGDSSRVGLFFYLAVPSDPVKLIPKLSAEGGCITLDQFNNMIELRYTTHGPMVRDEWYCDDNPGNGVLTVVTITPNG